MTENSKHILLEKAMQVKKNEVKNQSVKKNANTDDSETPFHYN